MKVKYCGPAKDYSGYGEANRHDIAALASANVQVTTEIPVYTLEASDYGKLGEIAVEAENKPLGYSIKIIHTTPNVYKMYMEQGKYNVGRAFWETDKVPLEFATNLQLVDEIWTGSPTNAKAIVNAGVTRPIHVIPEAIDASLEVDKVKPYLTGLEDSFKFYSIFEWTERKNPKALLEAYWRAFENKPKAKVALMIKTYVDNFKAEKRKEIEQDIRKLKTRLALKHYAPVFLYLELMDRHQIYRFHKTGNCFISAHRGEGWGIPQMEALLMGNPIISTNFGGIHDYLTHKKNALLVGYTMEKVNNTRNKQWYTPDQNWASIDIEELSKNIEWVYKNKEKAKKIGAAGRKFTLENFSLEAVGKKMLTRLREISTEMYNEQL